jgi:hypothetical protein
MGEFNFLLGAAGAIALLLLVVGLDLVLQWLTPSPKGRLKVSQTRRFMKTLPGPTLDLIEDRLRSVGFLIDLRGSDRLHAHRPKRSGNERYRTVGIFEFAPLKVEVSALARMQDTELTLDVQIQSFVTVDTGETKYLNALAEDLLDDRFDPAIRPRILARDCNGRPLFLFGSVALFVALTPFVSFMATMDGFTAVVLHFCAWCALIVAGPHGLAKAAARRFPKEYRASVWSLIGHALSLLGFGLAPVAVHHATGEWHWPAFVIYAACIAIFTYVSFSDNPVGATPKREPEQTRRDDSDEAAAAPPLPVQVASDGSLTIELPIRRSKGTALFLGFWLCGWAVGEIAGVLSLFGALFGSRQFLSNASALFMVVWLTGWTVGGIMTFWAMGFHLSAREVLTFYGDWLTIDRRWLWTWRRQRHLLNQIRGFRFAKGSWSMNHEMNTMLAFEADGKTVRLGRNLGDEDARRAERTVRDLLQPQVIPHPDGPAESGFSYP